MLAKPDLPDHLLVARLRTAYGLRVAELAFLPLGLDVNTAVYRVVTSGGSAYFLKLRQGPFDEMSVAIPALLAGQGIGQIIAPVRAAAGRLWTTLPPFTIMLYPFVDGSDANEVTLSERQWVEFGAALKRIHAAVLPAALSRALPREIYSPHWRDQVKAFQSRLRAAAFQDPVAVELAALMQVRAAVIDELVAGAEQLAQSLQGRPHERILCHADLHAANLLIGRDGSLYIVDWDTLLLAPKERDLMFVGSGLGPGWNQARQAVWFYEGYGPTEIDPVALAYYRCERIVEDIAAFCGEILAATADGQDRSRAIRYLASQFEPNAVVEIAQRSYQAVEAARAVT
jgi:spectinomycin phosphotransferase